MVWYGNTVLYDAGPRAGNWLVSTCEVSEEGYHIWVSEGKEDNMWVSEDLVWPYVSQLAISFL